MNTGLLLSNRKRALVIGNATYGTFTLLNSSRDASDFRKVLLKCGFEVQYGIDCNREKMSNLIDSFEATVKINDVCLIYFSGHGIQYDNKSLLLSVDAPMKSSREKLLNYCIDAQNMLTRISVRSKYMTILILDCCRAPHSDADINYSFNQPINTMILYACASGTVINDSYENSRNGMLMKHLLIQLAIPNKSLDSILRAVTCNVIRDTNGKQVPSTSSTITIEEPIFLNPDVESLSRVPDIPENARWLNAAKTIIRNLHVPEGITVNWKTNTVFVADYSNHRIVSSRVGENKQLIVVQGQEFGDSINQLNCPSDLIIDYGTNCMLICDFGNKRIVKWPLDDTLTSGESFIKNVCCYGLAMSESGIIYVTDIIYHAVREFQPGSTVGIVVAGGNGAGNGLHQLNQPHYIALDIKGSIYISDTKNDRVVKWTKGRLEGEVVAGGSQSKEGALLSPLGLVVDRSFTIYVVDGITHKISCWRNGEKLRDILTERMGLAHPRSFCFDHHYNLYVVDRNQSSVFMFPYAETHSEK